MSLWKKMATPSSGTARMTSAAASWNQRCQSANGRCGSSDVSGSDVTTLASRRGALAVSQASASA